MKVATYVIIVSSIQVTCLPKLPSHLLSMGKLEFLQSLLQLHWKQQTSFAVKQMRNSVCLSCAMPIGLCFSVVMSCSAAVFLLGFSMLWFISDDAPYGHICCVCFMLSLHVCRATHAVVRKLHGTIDCQSCLCAFDWPSGYCLSYCMLEMEEWL